METHNAALATYLPRHFDLITVVNPRGRAGLALYMLRALWAVVRHARKVDTILLGDGVLAVMVPLARLVAPRTVILGVLHGLDITYPKSLYQGLWVHVFMRLVHRFIVVSRATAAAAKARGIEEARLCVIPNGIELPTQVAKQDRATLEGMLGHSLGNRQVLVLLGRLVRRKGAAWFIRNVMPALTEKYLLVVAGDGPERAHMETAITELGLAQSVVLLGRVSDEMKQHLLASADLLVQPNIPVEGDMEGFGLVVLEAAASGLPVVAARLEGLEDAVQEGRTGWLLPPGDAAAWRTTLLALADQPEALATRAREARDRVRETGTWEVVAAEYAAVIESDLKSPS